MACSHSQQLRLCPPRPAEPVFREECTLCFDSVDDPDGVDVCLSCFNGACRTGRNHSQLHYESTKHPLVLNIRRRPNKAAAAARRRLDRVAIMAETDKDRYITTTSVRCLFCRVDDIDATAEPLATVVSAVLAANSFSMSEDVKAWELELTTCEHTRSLRQTASRKIASQDLGHCSMCDLGANLWLCLGCGNLGCGRKQFGGIDGNSHALAHSDATGHHVAVKLGSLTAEGTADVFCYSCGEERLDPSLVDHLDHWGIDISGREKTEKSLAEMQLEQNLKWEFSMTGDDGKDLNPVFGAGFTGLKNLGNSCYINSCLQALFALPEFQSRYFSSDQASTKSSEPATDLELQLRKVAHGLLSGRYSVPNPDAIDDEDGNKGPGWQRGIPPTMLKAILGRNHAEFSTNRQQDAYEFLLHLLAKISAAPHSPAAQNPVEVFKFGMEQRLQCKACKRVRYTTETNESITVVVPARKTAGKVSDEQAGQFEPVTLAECLDLMTAPEHVSFSCPACKSTEGSVKQTLFKSFPRVLVVCAYRFAVVNWVPTKQDVPVVVSDDNINFDSYISAGFQGGEVLLEENEAASEPSGGPGGFQPNSEALQALMDMGFAENRSTRALHATGNVGSEAAIEWLFDHNNDADIDQPLPALAGPGAQTEELSSDFVDGFLNMGFTRAHAAKAYRGCGSQTLEEGINWLLTHPEALEAVDDVPASSSNQSSDRVSRSEYEAPQRPVRFQLDSIICHKGNSIHAGHYVAFVRKSISPAGPTRKWILFNDEKVAEATNVEEMKKFAYVYFFRRM